MRTKKYENTTLTAAFATEAYLTLNMLTVAEAVAVGVGVVVDVVAILRISHRI